MTMTNEPAPVAVERRPLQGPEYVAQMRSIGRPARHMLKTWPPYFDDIVSGRKRFEARKNDQDLRVGDYLDLIEYDMNDGAELGLHHTGRSVQMVVTYILEGGQFGIEDGHVVMGIEPFAPSQSDRQCVGEVERVAETAISQNDAMRQELANVGNLISDLARAMRVDQADPDGQWPDLAGRVRKLIDAALSAMPAVEGDQNGYALAFYELAKLLGIGARPKAPARASSPAIGRGETTRLRLARLRTWRDGGRGK